MLANVVRTAARRQLRQLTKRQLFQIRRLSTFRRVQRGNTTYLRSLAIVRQSFEKSLRVQSVSKRFNGEAAQAAPASGAKPSNGGGDGGDGNHKGSGMGQILLLGAVGIASYFGYYKYGPGAVTGSEDFPVIKSKKSLCAKYLTPDMYNKYKTHKTATAGYTLDQVIRPAVVFDNQNVGVYAGDLDSYFDYKDLFDPIIKDYHKFSGKHKSDMNVNNLSGNIANGVPVKSTRIRVGRNIVGFGLSPGISREHRLEVESLMKEVFSSLKGDLAGTYYPLLGMDEKTRQKLVDDHFLFMSGDPNLIESGMERDWPEGRGIFHNKDKTFLVWVNEEDQLRIISMQKGGDVKQVFERLSRGIAAIEEILNKHGKKFAFDDRLGYIHTCPTNLGTGMRASVHIDLAKLTAKLGGHGGMKQHCKDMHLQARGTRGESSGETGTVYDISNLHRLGYTEVELVQTMIDGVNTLWKENQSS